MSAYSQKRTFEHSAKGTFIVTLGGNVQTAWEQRVNDRRSSGEGRMRTFVVTAMVVAVAVLLVFAWSASRLQAEEWVLMGREGGCVTLAQAAARRPLLSGVTTPDQLVAKLRQQGEEVRRQDIEQGDVTVVQVDAPGLELGLIFVPRSICR